MNNQIHLVNGKIPANTECPFRSNCGSALDGNCHHQGIIHAVPYSCATARVFEIAKLHSNFTIVTDVFKMNF